MATGDERCVCGRDKSVIHCAACGSTTCYAKPTQARVIQTEQGPLRVMMYRCRRCGLDFDDIDRARCEAPERGLSMKARRLLDKAEDIANRTVFETPEDRDAWLQEHFGGRSKNKKES